MIKVENFTVTVKYTVGLGDVEIPYDVYEELERGYDEMYGFDPSRVKYLKACDWLTQNIQESDCMDWELEIDEME